MNITQGAVSQKIRLLEKALEVELFARLHNALELTRAGAGLFGAVAAGLDAISAGVGLLQPDTVPQTVTISATDGMAASWLKPLIDCFRAAHPSVGFVVLASDEDDRLRNYSAFNLVLLCGNERCEGGEVLHFLFPEVAQPLCSPAYLAALGPFADAESLNRANLPHLHEQHWSADAIGWQPFGLGGMVPRPRQPLGQRGFGSIRQQGRAVDRGGGGGRGHNAGLASHDRRAYCRWASGFAHPATLSAGRGNFLKCQTAALERPAAARFIEHLLDSLGT